MNDPKDVIAFYLQRIQNASHPIEERIIKDDLFLYYYRLSETECEDVRPLMQSLLDEKRIEMEAHDPLLKRAGELLHRLAAKQPTSV
jgi:hypothetical protein